MTIIDQAILEPLENQPLSSVWKLVELTCIPTTMVDRHFIESLGFVAKHLHWVRHSPTVPQKGERVTRLKGLLHQLLLITDHGSEFNLTFDES
jgi:hypothetical protein